MTSLLNWLDSRTGIRSLSRAALYEHIPGGARWRYVWGSTLMFAFAVQMVTGFFLWAAYSPSSQTAWESVFYIQNQMWGGAVLRGIHHFMAQTMIILLGLHMLRPGHVQNHICAIRQPQETHAAIFHIESALE